MKQELSKWIPLDDRRGISTCSASSIVTLQNHRSDSHEVGIDIESYCFITNPDQGGEVYPFITSFDSTLHRQRVLVVERPGFDSFSLFTAISR